MNGLLYFTPVMNIDSMHAVFQLLGRGNRSAEPSHGPRILRIHYNSQIVFMREGVSYQLDAFRG